MPAKGDAKKDNKKQMKPKEFWEDLCKESKAAAKEFGFRDRNPILSMFEDVIEEKKDDDFPNQIIVPYEIEACLVKVLCKSVSNVCTAGQYNDLRCLRFWNCAFGDIGVKYVAEGLLVLPSVTKLEIIDCLVGPQGAGYMAETLRKISSCNLKLLKLDHNAIGSQGAALLAKGISYNSKLTFLSLNYCSIDKFGGDALSVMLKSPEVQVKTLNLEGNDLGSAGMVDFAVACMSNSSLNKLNISLNNFGGEVPVMQALCSAFRSNPNLTDINMDGNLIGDDGLKFLIENLHDCKHIACLDVTPFVNPQHLTMLGDWLVSNASSGDKSKKGSKKGGKKAGGKKKKK
mmetsp:Transcript_21145/g.41942  ORF Transcript_21145/g.41942 Transcript_21145/m.41942 type:complete len:344 (+) Transcript_21145:36-1067(+)|eukprot:CAMPEP_0175141696 /NCGR_PEP_ID=MMETSP0087-20121206/12294_1 /TAXON_ID=136419 /ORGANISM="Unknown Unknown, Strain D1" /LENGTH=343 /DNA_ID=CAMNT_0016425231 /DNA_START=29 /DNA_END=1060 /DNA_ORIENTATION=-